LNAALHSKGKLLTAAVVALGPNGEGVSSETFDLMDFVNIMAYDGAGPEHSPYQYAEDALAYWHGRGLSADKSVLGVPFYSHPSPYTPYRKLVVNNPEAAEADQTVYLGTTVNYNGLPTMRHKTELAMQQASGVMIWTLAHDTADATSLLAAIYATAHATGP
jgi:hypothetical protein